MSATQVGADVSLTSQNAMPMSERDGPSEAVTAHSPFSELNPTV